MLNGLGGPGAGYIGKLEQPEMSFSQWLEFMGAGGYGMGRYGYPVAYGISPLGQQNKMLNEQWGWDTVGNFDEYFRNRRSSGAGPFWR